MGLVEAWGGNPFGWVIANILQAFWNFGWVVSHPSAWAHWSDPEAMIRFIYYGASTEFFFVVFDIFLIVTAIGLWKNGFMWGCVRVMEKFANTVGRFFAWAGFVMVVQQIIIVFMQRVFAVAELSFGIGKSVTYDVSWWSEELKLYNAMIVCLCATYTFVQGGHVRVDLVYSRVSYRTKKLIDMLGSLFFMMPFAVLLWLYGWFFMWRHLVVPNFSASDTLTKMLPKARVLRWNVETTGFSPNGFSAYILFKVLLLCLVAMIFLQAVTYFYRSYLERKGGPDAEGRYHDKDAAGDPQAELVASIH